MEYTCAQTRYRFLISPERVLGNGIRTHANSKGKKSPLPEKFSAEDDRTHDVTSCRILSSTHYQLSYFGPVHKADAFARDLLGGTQCVRVVSFTRHERHLNTFVPDITLYFKHTMFFISNISCACISSALLCTV